MALSKADWLVVGAMLLLGGVLALLHDALAWLGLVPPPWEVWS